MKLFTGAYAPYLACTTEENGSLCSTNCELPIEPQARTGSREPLPPPPQVAVWLSLLQILFRFLFTIAVSNSRSLINCVLQIN